MEKADTTIIKDLHRVHTRWSGKMHFKSSVNDHIIHLDKLARHGGEDTGPRPKPLILSAIGGCTGMEIISILEKMRLKISDLQIDVTGELNDAQPKIYHSIHILFSVNCDGAETNKIERAIRLATDEYCGVVAMARHFATVTYDISYL